VRTLTADVLQELIKGDEPPCISFYQPTHRTHPHAQQDAIRYKNLLRKVEHSLREKYSRREVAPLLKPFQMLADDHQFWQHQRDGLAILASTVRLDVFRLQRPVKELVVVADSFHVKPLLRMLQSADRYQVLCLDLHKAKLFEGNRDALDEVDVGDMPATITAALGDQLTESHQNTGVYGKRAGRGHLAQGGTASFPGMGARTDEAEKDRERFFQHIDREVLERFSRPSGLPLILVALAENQAEFRRVSNNPFLQPHGVAKHPDSLTLEQLRTDVWQVVEPKYLARLAQLIDHHRAAVARELGASELDDVAQAAAAMRIGLLMVEADRVIPGRFEPATGKVHPGRLDDPEVGDVIDDLAETVLRTGGEVVVVPAARMPTDTGMAATFRH
jgi:hypothetical protein